MRYWAPEMFDLPRPPPDFHRDIYAFGKVLHELGCVDAFEFTLCLQSARQTRPLPDEALLHEFLSPSRKRADSLIFPVEG